MTKRKLARSAGSVFLSLALAVSGIMPGASSVMTAYAADTATIVPASESGEDKQGTGEMNITLSITKTIENSWIDLSASEFDYDGSTKKPTITVKYKVGEIDQTLTENTDYTVTIKDSSETEVTEPKNVGTYTITVTAKDGSFYTGSGSKTYEIKKSTPDAPAAPTVESKAKTSVTLTTVEGYEYSMDGTTWQQGTEFAGLLSGTEYSFYQRVGATDNTNPSNASEALKVTTDEDTYSMEITLVITPESAVINKINNLPDADKVATTDKDDINAARKAFDELTDEERGNIPEDVLKKLTDAETALVEKLIDALPGSDSIKDSDKDAVQEARAAYDKLEDKQKDVIDAEKLAKLEAAESALKVLDVNTKLNALPEVTRENKKAAEAVVKTARDAYDALTKEEQAKVDAEALAKLEAAESTLKVLDVEDKLNALPEVTKDNKEASEEAVKEARASYEALTKEEQTKVDKDALAKLEAAESAIKVLDVNETLNALPGEADVKLSDKAAIEAARAAYDALTDAEKEKVDAAALTKLTAAEKALDEAEKKEAADTDAADKVTKSVNALPASDKVATTDKAAIEAARKAYDALTAEQKAKVTPDTLKKLEAAEKALATAEKKETDDTDAAKKVNDAIGKLPASDKVATIDKAAIEAARKAYDALTADQKKKVSADTLKKLTDAEAALKTAEAKDKAAKELEAAKAEAQAAMNEQVTVTQKGNKFTVKWKKSTSADGYYVYAQYCGKKATKPAKTITKNTTTKTTITKINGKKINQKRQFRVYVVPYKIIDGKKVALGKSTVAHLVGAKSTKYSNVKKLTLTKKKYTVKVGKTAKIKAKVTLVNNNKKHIPKSHGAKFRYKSSDTSIATVDKNGKIKGIKKGKCTIYVYSINGLVKKAKVTIK